MNSRWSRGRVIANISFGGKGKSEWRFSNDNEEDDPRMCNWRQDHTFGGDRERGKENENLREIRRVAGQTRHPLQFIAHNNVIKAGDVNQQRISPLKLYD